MGLFDILKRTEQIIKSEANSLINRTEQKVGQGLQNEIRNSAANFKMTTREFTYDSLPLSLEALKALQKNPKDFFETAALAVLALAALFFVLLVPYIKHYFGLENGVQRLYDLYAELEKMK